MKRHSRRPILDLYDRSASPSTNKHRKFQKPVENVKSKLDIASFTSDEDDSSNSNLDGKVQGFLKELESETTSDSNMVSAWQECYDESTGYPYYWNMETNEVTWDMPLEYKTSTKKPSVDNTKNLFPAFQQNSFNDKTTKSRGDTTRTVYRVDKKSFHKKPTVDNKFKRHSSDSEDEKIEMITSYGEESESDEDSPKKILSPLKNSLPLPTLANLPKVPIISPTIYRIKPEPQIIKPQSLMKYDQQILDYNLKPPPPELSTLKKPEIKNNIRSDVNNDIDDTVILNRLRSQAKLLQELGGEVPQEVEKLIESEKKVETVVSQVEIENKPSLSLVAGYGEDSDLEDEIEIPEKVSASQLFPIVETPQIENSLFPIIHINESKLELPVEESDNKIKIIETEIIDTKAFKRKRRIALDILPSSSKPITKEEFTVNNEHVPDEVSQRKGFGFCEKSEETNVMKPVSMGISFIKAETMNSEKSSDNNEEDNSRVEGLSDMIELVKEKVSFLVEGKDAVSPVQIIQIQLHTLIEAHNAGALTNAYLNKWLVSTSSDISKLEKDAAPSGWDCHWDRSNKRYFYRNQQTGESQWQYPDTDIIGGTEAMDICTTPPPLEELPKVAVVETQQKCVTPPPPQITEKAPTPPPPPIISNGGEEKKPFSDLPPLPPGSPPRVLPPPPPSSSSPVQLHGQPLPPGIDPADLPFITARPNDGQDAQFPEPAKEQITNSTPSVVENSVLGSELESFYSDIASLESSVNTSTVPVPVAVSVSVPVPELQQQKFMIETPQPIKTPTVELKKKKKGKVKMSTGLTMKMKDVSSLVEKWKKVQHDYKE